MSRKSIFFTAHMHTQYGLRMSLVHIQDVTSSVHIQNPKAGLSCVGFLPAKLTCSDEIVMTCSDDMFLRKQRGFVV